MTYDVLTHCDGCGEFKFCRLCECADEVCAFCRDCDETAEGDAAAAVEAAFDDDERISLTAAGYAALRETPAGEED